MKIERSISILWICNLPMEIGFKNLFLEYLMQIVLFLILDIKIFSLFGQWDDISICMEIQRSESLNDSSYCTLISTIKNK